MTSRTGLTVGLLNVLTVVCYISHYGSSSQIFLWIGVIASFAAVFAGISGTLGKGYKLVSVILFLFCLRILPMLRLPFSGFTFSADAADALQLSQQINEKGRFDFGMGTGRAVAFSFFPAMYILTVVLANISGLSIETIAYLLPLLTGVITITVLYAIVKWLSDEVAILAIVVYSLGRTFIFFDDKYVPEAFGLIFYAISLMMFFYIHVYKNLSPKFAAIGILACVMVAVSHHWSSFNLLFILTFFFFFIIVYDYFLGRLQKRDLKLRFSAIPLFTSACIISAWFFFVAYQVTYADLRLFAYFLRSFTDPTIHRAYPMMPSNTPLERVLIVAGYSVLVIVGVFKFVSSMFERDKASNRIFFQSWFVFGSVFIFFSYFLAPVAFYYSGSYPTRTWSFAFFGLSPMISWGLIEIPFAKLARRKKLTRYAPLLLILPLISTVLVGPVGVRNPSHYPKVESYRNTGIWIRYHLYGETVVVDSSTRELVATYGRIKAISPVMTDNVTDEEIIVYKSESLSFVAPAGSIIVVNNQLDELRSLLLETGNPLVNATVYLKDTDLRCQRIYDCGSLIILIGIS